MSQEEKAEGEEAGQTAGEEGVSSYPCEATLPLSPAPPNPQPLRKTSSPRPKPWFPAPHSKVVTAVESSEDRGRIDNPETSRTSRVSGEA